MLNINKLAVPVVLWFIGEAIEGGNIKKLFNTSSKDYRKPELKATLPNLSNKQKIDLLSKQGNLIRRPFLVGESVLLQGYNRELWQEAFSK